MVFFIPSPYKNTLISCFPEYLFFFNLIGFIVFPWMETPLKAMTDLNNEFCERTCLYAPLPRGWNMISSEWKPFEDFHFLAEHGLAEGSGVTAQSAVRNAGRWHHVRFSAPSFPAFIYYLFIYLWLSKCLSVGLFIQSISHSAYQQENTWILVSTLEFNGLGMNLGTLRHFKYFDITLVLLELICTVLYFIFSLSGYRLALKLQTISLVIRAMLSDKDTVF